VLIYMGAGPHYTFRWDKVEETMVYRCDYCGRESYSTPTCCKEKQSGKDFDKQTDTDTHADRQ
jgi:hypothetical protein